MRFRKAGVGALLLAAGIGALGVGCEAAEEDGRGSEHEALEPMPTVDLPQPMTEAEATDPSVLLMADLEPVGGSDISGTVRVMALQSGSAAIGGGFELHARVEGLPHGAHGWHIHAGRCGAAGAAAVPFTAMEGGQALAGAEPLVPGDDGVAQQTVTVRSDVLTFGQLQAGDYSVDVHAGDGGTVACATL